ncbi:MAG: UDP-N-acetylmuramoyl-L-alanine--D-glutamate ligase [Candidatus Omnitrophica bacterium]|nr:UDP-N-acetylmuramoyl-L-alanine--D-glutamate ligase [Candidatus Omnitrophota bacterium]
MVFGGVMDLKGKKVSVIGLGNSGSSAAMLAADFGAEVWATDAGDSPALREVEKRLRAKGIKVEIGIHTEDYIKTSDLVVVSPGVEETSLALKWAKKHGITVIGEMEFGYRFCKGRIIAITGTNGKSTVTALIGQILKDGGFDTVVCGNIGNSLSGEIDRIKEDTWVVLEVSSFQLETIVDFKPHIAVILNITDDHMDRYSKFSDYFAEKMKVFKNQDKDDHLVLNYDAENLRGFEKIAKSKVSCYKKSTADIFDTRLKGVHNTENILASILVSSIVGVKSSSMLRTIKDFKGLSHRFETVAVIDGVEYIDDSKGTTVDSTARAIDSCKSPVILIAGGKDKYSDYGAIKSKVKAKVKDLILIGEAKDAIAKALKGASSVHSAKDMDEAVRLARRLAKKGDSVLLSPMCSSFDMYKSYKHRGEVFRKAVDGIRCEAQEARYS